MSAPRPSARRIVAKVLLAAVLIAILAVFSQDAVDFVYTGF
jgi:hypothetical protein